MYTVFITGGIYIIDIHVHIHVHIHKSVPSLNFEPHPFCNVSLPLTAKLSWELALLLKTQLCYCD